MLAMLRKNESVAIFLSEATHISWLTTDIMLLIELYENAHHGLEMVSDAALQLHDDLIGREKNITLPGYGLTEKQAVLAELAIRSGIYTEPMDEGTCDMIVCWYATFPQLRPAILSTFDNYSGAPVEAEDTPMAIMEWWANEQEPKLTIKDIVDMFLAPAGNGLTVGDVIIFFCLYNRHHYPMRILTDVTFLPFLREAYAVNAFPIAGKVLEYSFILGHIQSEFTFEQLCVLETPRP